jgi:hypothetical protein
VSDRVNSALCESDRRLTVGQKNCALGVARSALLPPAASRKFVPCVKRKAKRKDQNNAMAAPPSLRRSVSVLGRAAAHPDDGDDVDDVTEAFVLSDDSSDDQGADASDFDDDDDENEEGDLGKPVAAAVGKIVPLSRRDAKGKAASKASGPIDMSSQATLTTSSSKSADPLLGDNDEDWQTDNSGSHSIHRCAYVHRVHGNIFCFCIARDWCKFAYMRPHYRCCSFYSILSQSHLCCRRPREWRTLCSPCATNGRM